MIRQKDRKKYFLVSTPSQDLSILFQLKSHELNIYQRNTYEVNLGRFDPRDFDCDAEPKLSKRGTL